MTEVSGRIFFGDKITSTIGDAEKKGEFSSAECHPLIIDWDNERVFLNSPLGNCLCNTFDGIVLKCFRGCAEINEEGEVVINDFDRKVIYSPY